MKFIITMLTAIAVTLFSAYPVFAEETVAVVNGKSLTQKDLDNHITMIQTMTRKKVDNPKHALENLIDREIMYQEAKKQKIDQDPEMKFLIEFQAREMYNNELLKQTLGATPITDDEVKKLYDEKIKSLEIKEYKVRHILFKKDAADGESQAKAVIAQLDTGKDFIELAKSKSQGPSAAKGGDIGWMNLSSMRDMPGFAQALSEMKKGSYSKKPVQSNFGWHVLKLDDIRKKEPATFEQSKKQLRQVIQQQRIQVYVKSLRDKAKVEIKLK
ncbi:hypothetical protein MNBD_GAMMA21-629 [hydrothermal vent metagenome]|uniref:PpiC domain-containing protein n=1 Tax=hydrothermal vent metagenome TaxID=652676 RepID=A0A3B0ZBW4_9ZZZZ